MSQWLVGRTSALLARKASRRSVLLTAAVAGSAVAVAPRTFLMEPTTAFTAICGPDNTYAAGYTAFCCTIFEGENRCPPGTFVGGWWRADGSHYCCSGGGPGARYYIDCQARCTGCSSGCGGQGSFCSSGCWNCSPHAASGTCDERRVCANVFRYGQCHTEIPCGGPVACRVVSCTPPFQLWSSCGSTTLYDDRTADHTAPCLSGACA